MFRVVPGCEGETIELFRTAAGRCAEKAGRGENPPETLDSFVTAETVRKFIADGTHESFLAVVVLEPLNRKNANRSEGERDETAVQTEGRQIKKARLVGITPFQA